MISKVIDLKEGILAKLNFVPDTTLDNLNETIERLKYESKYSIKEHQIGSHSIKFCLEIDTIQLFFENKIIGNTIKLNHFQMAEINYTINSTEDEENTSTIQQLMNYYLKL